MSESSTSRWYLRSMGDRDTHRGDLNGDSTITAECGLKFRPIGLPGNRVSLSGFPPDPEQVCPKCRTVR